MDLVEKAKVFASAAHAGQKYGSGADYTAHLGAVVNVLREFYGESLPEWLEASAWLHDVVEDTEGRVTADVVRREFGIHVHAMVVAVTDEPGANRHERHEKTYPKTRRAGADAIALKLADRIGNVRASLQDVSGGKLGMYKKEHRAFRDALFTNPPSGSIVGKMWSHLDDLVDRIVAPKKSPALARLEAQADKCWLDHGYEEEANSCPHESFYDCLEALLNAIRAERQAEGA